MINDSLRKLKSENNSKTEAKTVENELKVMKEHKQSRAVYLETLEKEYKQLSSKYNLLKEK